MYRKYETCLFRNRTDLFLLQEIIDMCDFAVGLSRQLNGSIIPSERKLKFLPLLQNNNCNKCHLSFGGCSKILQVYFFIIDLLSLWFF